MTELDFLPDWYHVRLERRRSYFAFVWLGAGLLVVIGLWIYLANGSIRQARADLQTLQDERNAVNQELIKIDELRATRDELARKSSIADTLEKRPDAIHVLNRLSELLPQDIHLVAIQVDADTGRKAVGRPGAGASPKASDRDDPAAEARYRLTITGTCPTDVPIANFIARLSGSNAFVGVEMGYTKDVKRSGKLMREFEMSCQIANWKTPAEALDKDSARSAQP